MSSNSYRFARLHQGELSRTQDLTTVMSPDGKAIDPAREHWLFVSPHDDDLCLGAGLLLQAALAWKIDVWVLVVTDGCLGYCTLNQRDDIVAIRREETYASFELLGLPQERVVYAGYPDGGLAPYIGRRRQEEPRSMEGFVGLQNDFTHYLRRFRATRVFVPTPTDLHPDHRITYSELMISLFHASGPIWPELGEALAAAPTVYELAVYCDFAAPPNLEIQGDAEVFERKLKSIEAYQSQSQIAALVENTRQAGPVEYLREIEFNLYSPNSYRDLFVD